MRTTVLTWTKAAILAAYGLCVRIRVVGSIGVPLKRGFIVAANHLNGADSFVIQLALHTRVFFATSARWFRNRFSRFFMRNVCDAIPVDSDDPLLSLAGMRDCMATLRLGGVIGIYPEGRFHPPGPPSRIANGAAYLAVKTGAPIVPVYLRNFRLRRPIDDSKLSRECWTGFLTVADNLFNVRIEVAVGDPILPDPSPPVGRVDLYRTLDRINGELREEFEELAASPSSGRAGTGVRDTY
jgi:1-acyl-sn-glycerol-3-phosphate acyltransferase